MPCEIEKTKNSITYFCSRGRREKPKCYKCGKPATKLCDYRNLAIRRYIDEYGRKIRSPSARLDTCSRPMCDECSASAHGLDFCEEHGDCFRIQVTLRANIIYEKMIDDWRPTF